MQFCSHKLPSRTVAYIYPHTYPRTNTKTRKSTTSHSQAPSTTTTYFPATDLRPIILYDGICNLCNGGVNFALRLDKLKALRFAALQSTAGKSLLRHSGRDPDDISSIVLVTQQQSYIKSEAVLKIAAELPQPIPLVASIASIFPLEFKDFVYDLIANNRYSLFGKTDTCRVGDVDFTDRFIED
jgi:predicted DCC family thiol-disulfide oxidoreductase YuxK